MASIDSSDRGFLGLILVFKFGTTERRSKERKKNNGELKKEKRFTNSSGKKS